MELEKKTIAINSFYLYMSSFFQLIVGLYTSRALLQALGVEDFGIYGVVGGIIGLLSFVNMAMSSASSRYLTFELANGTIDSQKRIFSVVFTVHVVIAILTLVLGETIGLWYVANKLVVPEGRMYAAHWVYQAAIFMSIINIIQVPYTASITAHEKMGFLSLWNSLNIFLKLVVIIFLYLVFIDKLIFYSFLMAGTSLFIVIGYFAYCKKYFEECVLLRVKDKNLFKEILSFAGFNAFSSFASAIRTQGTSLLINRFFGVALNAAGSIASMVSGYIISFTANIITAFRPQIVKCYATADYKKMDEHIQMCIVYCLGSFSLMSVPIFLEMDYILSLWLGIVPKFTAIFCRISLIGASFGLLNMIIVIAIQATSQVKNNSIAISIISICSIFILYVLFALGLNVYVAYILYAAIDCFILFVSIWNLKRLIPEFKVFPLLRKTFILIAIIIISTVITYYAKNNMSESIFRFLITALIYYGLFTLSFFTFILSADTRKKVLSRLKL
ncbi:hypothetical protein [Prevotella histicola]|uniref:hypothetical protein n=1 Tax=Prevotella histicola TaxID=470565 RepID=UPI0028E9E66D|nr:hypothetical protein [Prevotella histicola]